MGWKPWDVGRATLAQFNIAWDSYCEQQQEEDERQIEHIHLLASLMGFSVHDPKKMPSLKKLIPKKAKKISEEEDAIMREQGARAGVRVP